MLLIPIGKTRNSNPFNTKITSHSTQRSLIPAVIEMQMVIQMGLFIRKLKSFFFFHYHLYKNMTFDVIK